MTDREQYATPLDDDTRRKVVQFLDDLFRAHEGHPWRQVGRCVYCSCEESGPRLYQGTIPEGHPIAPPRPRKPMPADEMRRRWGMD